MERTKWQSYLRQSYTSANHLQPSQPPPPMILFSPHHPSPYAALSPSLSCCLPSLASSVSLGVLVSRPLLANENETAESSLTAGDDQINYVCYENISVNK